jgi:uncharacterized SAM-binding protein YcdF (DUF218 family)
MILRFGLFMLILYVLGFFLFGVTLAEPAADDTPRTDAIVVITGGTGRIERAVEVLADKKGKRLLIAGADPLVTKADIARRLGGKRKLLDCCVDLGSESVDTRSNAEEARRWIDKRRYRSVRLITSDWHMRRAAYEFHRQLDDIELVEDAVTSQPNLMTLFAEYNKLLLRRIAVWIDL